MNPEDDPRYRAGLEAWREATGEHPADPVRTRALYPEIVRARAGRPGFLAQRRVWVGASLAALLLIALGIASERPGRLASAPSEQFATGPALRLLYRSGEVRLAHPSKSTAPEQRELSSQTMLSTGPSGLAVVESSGLARIDVLASSRLQLEPAHPRLLEGRAAFRVTRQAPGHSYQVQAGDCEVRVHGTAFLLKVEGGKLVGAGVSEGQVEVLREGVRAVLLGAGQVWGLPGEDPELPALLVAQGAQARAGALWVETEPPGAKIQLGEISVGRSPLLLDLSPGKSALTLTLEGHLPVHRSVELRSGELTRLRLVLVAGTEDDELLELSHGPGAVARPRPLAAASWRTARQSLAKHRCDLLERQVRTELLPSLSKDEARAQALALAAECRLRRREIGPALVWLEELLERYPDAPVAAQAAFDRARLLTELGRHAEALGALERFLAAPGNSALRGPATFRRCELLVRQRPHAEARVCLEGYLENFPDERRRPDALLLLAALTRNDGELSRAIQLYDELLSSAPTSVHAEEASFQIVAARKASGDPQWPSTADRYLERFPEGSHAQKVRSWKTDAR